MASRAFERIRDWVGHAVPSGLRPTFDRAFSWRNVQDFGRRGLLNARMPKRRQSRGRAYRRSSSYGRPAKRRRASRRRARSAPRRRARSSVAPSFRRRGLGRARTTRRVAFKARVPRRAPEKYVTDWTQYFPANVGGDTIANIVFREISPGNAIPAGLNPLKLQGALVANRNTRIGDEIYSHGETLRCRFLPQDAEHPETTAHVRVLIYRFWGSQQYQKATNSLLVTKVLKNLATHEIRAFKVNKRAVELTPDADTYRYKVLHDKIHKLVSYNDEYKPDFGYFTIHLPARSLRFNPLEVAINDTARCRGRICMAVLQVGGGVDGANPAINLQTYRWTIEAHCRRVWSDPQ